MFFTTLFTGFTVQANQYIVSLSEQQFEKNLPINTSSSLFNVRLASLSSLCKMTGFDDRLGLFIYATSGFEIQNNS